MTTEENILYQILNSVRAAELNSDEVADERLIRSFMRLHRAELINKYSQGGVTIQDVCFQIVPGSGVDQTLLDIAVTTDPFEYDATIPTLVQLPSYLGIILTTKEYYSIPVIQNENYHLSKFHIINKYQPKATIEFNKIIIFTGSVSPNVQTTGIPMSNIIASIKAGTVRLKAILDDPDKGFGYDWTTSQYPLPEEIIEEMKKNILRREFQIILSTKSDQVPNMKNDTLRYHDQGKVQQ